VPKLTEQDFLAPRFDEETSLAALPPPPPLRAARHEAAVPRMVPTIARTDEGGERPPERERRRRDEEPPVDPASTRKKSTLPRISWTTCSASTSTRADHRRAADPGDGLGASGGDRIVATASPSPAATRCSPQYLVNPIVGAGTGQGGVSIDVEHYRHRREEQARSGAAHGRRACARQAAITLE
jgi:hypothetical protein